MSWSPASGRRELEVALRRIGGAEDHEIDLAEAALLLAALDRPQVPLDRYRHHLSLLRRDTAQEGARAGADSDLGARVESLNRVIFGRYGYTGDEDTYESLDNADLMRVIDRRCGLPVTLGIVYLQTALSQGWEASGLAFPGHFLLRLELGAQRAIVDPFHGGRSLEPTEMRELLKTLAGQEAELAPRHYAPVDRRTVLLRLQNNIKMRLLRDHRPEDALARVEAMLLFAPRDAGSWREAGLLHSHLGNLRAGILALENFLEVAGAGHPYRPEAASLLRELHLRMN